MPKTTVEQELDTEARTTPFGMFNMAESYFRAARALKAAKLKGTHPDHPVAFLYYHSIELYLKSFLRLHGHSAKELASRKFGHQTAALVGRADQLGLELMDEDREILDLMANTDAVIRSRYLLIGAFYWPTIDGLDRVCKSIRVPIGQSFRRKGFPVRHVPLR